MPRKAKTRRHLAYQGGGRYSVFYRGQEGERVAIRYLVNTGKDYSPQHIGHDKAGAFLTTDAAVASTRDIRGHGHGTSRVKRARRQIMLGLWEELRDAPGLDLVRTPARLVADYPV